MKRQSGFSLIEMLIVIAMVGIIVTITVPSYVAYQQNENLKNAAKSFASQVFQLKQVSLTEGRMHRIDLAGNGYTVSACADPGSPCPTVFNNIGVTDFSSFGSGAAIVSQTFPGNQLVFQPRGTVSMGTLTLNNQRGSTAIVTVNITGRTSVEFDSQ